MSKLCNNVRIVFFYYWNEITDIIAWFPQSVRWTRTRSGASCPAPWMSVHPAALPARWRSSTSSICLPMSVKWREERSRQQTATAAAAWLKGTAGSRSRSSRPRQVSPDNRVLHFFSFWFFKDSLPSVSGQITGAVHHTRFYPWSSQLCLKSEAKLLCLQSKGWMEILLKQTRLKQHYIIIQLPLSEKAKGSSTARAEIPDVDHLGFCTSHKKVSKERLIKPTLHTERSPSPWRSGSVSQHTWSKGLNWFTSM